jgi:hypothetical protein
MHFQTTVPYQLHRKKTIRDQQCEKHADIRLQNQDDKDEDEPPVKS